MTGVSERARAHRREAASSGAVVDAREVLRVLRGLPRDRWSVLADRAWPDRAASGENVIVVGPSGIFAIRNRAWDWRHPVHRGAVVPAGSAAAMMAAVAPPEARRLVTPVLCLVGPEGVRQDVDGVAVCSPDTLLAMLLSRPARVSAAEVAGLAAALEARLPHAPRVPLARMPVPVVRQRRLSRALQRAGVVLVGGASALGAAALFTSPRVLADLVVLLPL